MKKGTASLRKVLRENGFVIRPTVGTSMIPLLREGRDPVYLKALKKGDEIKINDVVLFLKDGRYVLHRVRGIHGKKYEIIGDNRLTPDIVRRGNILAVMTGYYRDGGDFIPATDPDYLKYVEEKTSDLPRRQIIRPDMNEWIYLIKLLGCAIKGQICHFVPEGLDWESVLRTAEKHSIAATVFYALDKEKVPGDIYSSFRTAADKNTQKYILCGAERDTVFSMLGGAGIRHIPLKGVRIADMYPSPLMRESGDTDLLISPDDEKKAVSIMKELGYSVNITPVHDECMKKPLYIFELHNCLFREPGKKFEFFDSFYGRAVPSGKSEYEYMLTDEDFYYHFIAHFERHFSAGGTGLRSFADLYLIKRSYAERNIIPDRGILKQIGLDGFDREMTDLAVRMFDDPDSLTYEDIQYVMSSGTYGTISHHMSKKIRDMGKFRYFIFRMFPPYIYMCERFHILRKLPFLLPICWIIRFPVRMFSRHGRVHAKAFVKKFFKKNKKKQA